METPQPYIDGASHTWQRHPVQGLGRCAPPPEVPSLMRAWLGGPRQLMSHALLGDDMSAPLQICGLPITRENHERTGTWLRLRRCVYVDQQRQGVCLHSNVEVQTC